MRADINAACRAIVALALACGPALAAELPQRVSSLLGRFPADDAKARDTACAELIALGAPGLADVLARVRTPGQGDDAAVRFAVNGLAVHVTRPGAEAERGLLAESFLSALGHARDTDVAAFLLSQLRLFGGRESVPALAAYLGDARLAGPAAATLLTIGSPEATRSFLKALDAAPSSVRPTLVNALGERRSREAVPRLLSLAGDADETTRRAALAALANIGDPAAGAVLARAHVAASYRERAEAPALYLLYARRLVEAGRTSEGLAAAHAVLEGYTRPGEAQHAAAALALIVSAQGEPALPVLLATVDSLEPSLRGAALALAPRIPGSAATARWIEKAAAAPPGARAEIVDMLGWRGDPTASSYLEDSLRSADEGVRTAAIRATHRLGGNAVLAKLLPLVGAAGTGERAALRTALLGSPAARVVPELLRLLDSAPAPAKVMLVEVLGEKRAREAFEPVLRLVRDTDPTLRAAALGALGNLAGEAEVPRLVAMLQPAGEGEEVVRLREAIATAVLRNPDPERRAEGLLDLLARVDGAGKAAILGLLPRLGGPGPLRAAAEQAVSPDPAVQSAAVGALSRWPEPVAAEALLRVASAAPRPEIVRSALQGYARLVGRSELTNREKLAAFERALALSSARGERRAVLPAIASVREPESLRLLGRCLDDPELREAAGAALVDLASRQSPQEPWLSGHEAYSLLRRLEASLGEPTAKERVARVIAERLSQGGFVPLFDGRSLDGWKGLVADPLARAKMTREQLGRAQAGADTRMREHWRVADGVLVFDGKGESLCSRSDYGDFELLVDWKIEKGGDSGIYLRGSPQVQIWDAAANPVGSGGLYNNQQGKSQPTEKADRPVGEWNSFRIVMIGERVTVYLNDRRVVDETALENYWDRAQKIFPSGPIELQAHGNPLAFRNLYVREIPRDAPAPASDGATDDGFSPLFNGHDLTGWTGNVLGYAAEDGKIVVHPERAGGNLYSAREYADFVLRFEFKLTPAANNGIGIRAPLEGDAAYVGMELQVLEDGSPVYWELQPYQYHGSIYGVVPARRGALRPVGEWNSEEVTVKGRRVAVVVNGTTVVDADVDAASAAGTADHREHPGLARPAGHIGFLGHGSIVEFRNIRLRELR
jgi:HEAT repeat protein